MGRRGDGEMGRWGDGEMGRWGDGETGSQSIPQLLINIKILHFYDLILNLFDPFFNFRRFFHNQGLFLQLWQS